MDAVKKTNEVKWLFIDQMVDLVAAADIGRETINNFVNHRISQDKAMGRLRVCNHSLILSLFKFREIRIEYSQFLNSLNPDETKPIYEYAQEIRSRKIPDFRGKYAAHIWDRQKRPLSIIEGEQLLREIIGTNNEKALEFYNWIHSNEKPCVVSAIEKFVSYLKTQPGGDHPRF